jgi:hypothetical protein
MNPARFSRFVCLFSAAKQATDCTDAADQRRSVISVALSAAHNHAFDFRLRPEVQQQFDFEPCRTELEWIPEWIQCDKV